VSWDRQAQALAGYLPAVESKLGNRVLLYMQNSRASVIGFTPSCAPMHVVIRSNPMNRKAELEYLLQEPKRRWRLCGLEIAEQYRSRWLAQPRPARSGFASAYSEYVREPTQV